MNSKEFEILNEKMDKIFDMIVDMRERQDLDAHHKEVKELERKAEEANKEVIYRREDTRYIYDHYSDRRRYYNEIERRVSDRYQRCGQTPQETMEAKVNW